MSSSWTFQAPTTADPETAATILRNPRVQAGLAAYFERFARYDGKVPTISLEVLPDPPVAATCAYERCQAGGVILAGSPRVAEAVRARLAWPVDWLRYHPGCWAAEQRARGKA